MYEKIIQAGIQGSVSLEQREEKYRLTFAQIPRRRWTGVFVGETPDKDVPYEGHTSLRLTARPSIHILPRLCQHTPPAHMRDNPLVQQKIEELMTQGHSRVHCGCRMMAGITDRLVFLRIVRSVMTGISPSFRLLAVSVEYSVSTSNPGTEGISNTSLFIFFHQLQKNASFHFGVTCLPTQTVNS